MRQKEHLIVPVDELTTADDRLLFELAAEGNTRQGGGGAARAAELAKQIRPVVVVDMREFRSSLPYELFVKGLSVYPITLTVGDYVLSK